MYFVTGAAGFIGFHVTQKLLETGAKIVGVDNVNPYYDPALKKARLAELARHKNAANFTFVEADIADRAALEKAVAGQNPTHIIHLAAQAGVRYSLTHPFEYANANLTGFLTMLELARSSAGLQHFVYASSSSVYGNSSGGMLRVEDACDKPVSLYAATKRSGELLAHSYAAMHGLAATGLRFFTVYGPWGRPDMAYYSFTQALYDQKPITLYAGGSLSRDFTYVDDIVAGVIAATHTPPAQGQHRVFNLGNSHPHTVNELVEILENLTGQKAIVQNGERVTGDVDSTFADISVSEKLLGYKPQTALPTGLERFVSWYKTYHS